MHRRLGMIALVLALVVVASGCDWSQFGFTAAHTGYNPLEKKLGVADVGQLVVKWTATTGASTLASPVVANGVLYEGSMDNTFYALDAKTGVQLWTAPLQGPVWSAAAVADGMVYVTADVPQPISVPPLHFPPNPTVFAFDAAGARNCSGTPKTCTPLWSGTTGTSEQSAPAVSNGVVYIASQLGAVFAFDAATGKGLRRYDQGVAQASFGWSPTVGSGAMYAGSYNRNLYAFDTTGKNCTVLASQCTPAWSASTGGTVEAAAAVERGVVYVASDDGKLYAFDAAGKTNCSGSPPATCLPLWTATTGGSNESPSVANGVVYAGSRDGVLSAFDASGNTNCSGAPKSCAPLWTAPIGSNIRSTPTIANGVIYVAADSLGLLAFDANGTLGCEGLPKTCTPLWAWVGSGFDDSPVVVNSTVYASSPDGTVQAFALP